MAARNPQRTRARILLAARREFAAKGIGGARVDAIARRAGVNKRMLYHYFGSKDGLFQAVLLSTLADRLAHVPGEGADVADRWVDRSAFYTEASEYVRLLMWEALERPATEPAERPERAAAYARLRERILQDQTAGALPPEVDPGQWSLAELAICLLPLAFPQLTRITTGLPAQSDEFAAAHETFLRQVAARLGSAPAPAVPRTGAEGDPPTV